MAEKATVKKTATKKAAAPKAEVKAAAPKKCATKKAATKAAEVEVAPVAITVENVGFKAGDVYQTLSKAEKALSVEEIAKQAGIATEEVLLGIGWLMKEGKVKGENNSLVLA